jgi:hypothetical protein
MACAVTPMREAVSRSTVHREREAGALQVAREVAQRAELAHEARGPLGELVGVGVFEGVLVLRARGAGVDLEVLHGLEKDRDALDAWSRALEPRDDRLASASRWRAGLQRDREPPGVGRRRWCRRRR